MTEGGKENDITSGDQLCRHEYCSDSAIVGCKFRNKQINFVDMYRDKHSYHIHGTDVANMHTLKSTYTA